MRFIVAGLALALAAVPAAQAQQPSAAAPASQPGPGRDEVSTTTMQVNDPARAPVQAVEIAPDAMEARDAQQISARNVLAIIGAVVVVAALIALFR